MTQQRPALFLDRDGVLNVDRGFVARIEDVEWIEGAIDCIAAFKQLGWFVFIVTNQTGIAFDLYTEDDMKSVHKYMLEQIRAGGGDVDHIYHCMDHPDGTNPAYARQSFDRKPQPGMLMSAMRDFPVAREKSFLIGDKQTDIAAAESAGIAGYLFTEGNIATFAEWARTDFEGAAR